MLRPAGKSWRNRKAAVIESKWNSAESGLPPAGQVVEVWITLARSAGTTWLRGYLSAESGATSGYRWLNALTDEPFPSGWSVAKWRHIEVEAATDSGDHQFRESA